MPNYKKPVFWIIGIFIAACITAAILFLSGYTPQSPGTLPMSFGSADLDHDGTDETFRVSEIQEDLLYQLDIIKEDGSILWSKQAGTPHVGWDSIFLCTVNDEAYLLFYRPTMYQGMADYYYELFWLENKEPKIIESGSVSFSIHNNNLPTDAKRAEMKAFANRVNALLNSSIVLLSTQDSVLTYGGVSAEEFLETYGLFI